jgi:integrase
MSVYKHPKSPFYAYDFQLSGHRFHGSTKAKSKREAEAVERELRRKAREDLEQAKRTGQGPLTLDVAAGRFWTERGQNHACSDDTERNLARLIAYFGKDKRLDQITDADVASLVAWRRTHTIRNQKQDKTGNPVKLVSNSTVNRTTTIVLKALFTRAKKVWKCQFTAEPNWREHWLQEPAERVRELHDHEEDALSAAIRDDYTPWLQFAHATGLRLAETLLRWRDVNWAAGNISTRGKGGRTVTTYLTPSVREILGPLKGHHPEFVFTYVAKQTRGDREKGERYPITYAGAKTEWRRTRSRARVEDFRLHDLRHDAATKLLRATGNLKLVQRALNHSNLQTTSRYAHVADNDVAAALEIVSKSRKNSRTDTAKGGTDAA